MFHVANCRDVVKRMKSTIQVGRELAVEKQKSAKVWKHFVEVFSYARGF